MRSVRFPFDTSDDVAMAGRLRRCVSNEKTATSERWGWPPSLSTCLTNVWYDRALNGSVVWRAGRLFHETPIPAFQSKRSSGFGSSRRDFFGRDPSSNSLRSASNRRIFMDRAERQRPHRSPTSNMRTATMTTQRMLTRLPTSTCSRRVLLVQCNAEHVVVGSCAPPSVQLAVEIS